MRPLLRPARRRVWLAPGAPASRLAVALAVAGVLGAAPSAHATQPLGEFLKSALARGFDARESEAVLRQSTSESDVAFGRLLPALSARGVWTHNQFESGAQLPGSTTRLVITPKNQLDAFFQLDVPLVDVGAWYRYEAAQAQRSIVEARIALSSVAIARGISRAYHQHLAASALGAAAARSLEAAETNLALVQARRDAGAALELDVERARASVERARQDVADATLAGQLAARALETASGLAPEPAGESVADDLADEGPLAAWLARVGDRPEERVARESARASAAVRKAADAAILPTLSGNLQERLTNATGFADENSIYTAQLVLAWRYDWSAWKNAEAQAAAIDAAAVREERSRRAAEDAIHDAYRRVEAGLARARAARAGAAAAARAATLAAARFEAGAATQLDVVQAQRDAFLGEAASIQSDVELAAARVELRLAAGLDPTAREVP